MENELALVYVSLLDEGTPTIRPTNAEPLGGKLYRLLPTKRYDPEVETWEFLPGSIVVCERMMTDYGTWVLQAVSAVQALDSDAALRAKAATETPPVVVWVETQLKWLWRKTTMTRIVNAEPLGDDLFRILPKKRNNAHPLWKETSEFPPGSIVLCERTQSKDGVWELRPVRRVG